jgi:hypothetical protein
MKKAHSVLRARPIVASILSKIGRTERPPRDGIQLYHFNGTICLQKSIESLDNIHSNTNILSSTMTVKSINKREKECKITVKEYRCNG